MSDDSALTEAAREYAAAYAAHYTERDLAMALELYKKLMASHASAREAGYSRTQVQNIVNGVVPKQELLDAQMELALARLEHPISPDAGPIPFAPLAPMLAEWTQADLRPFAASTTWSEPLECRA
jgi:hypothetical protein